MGIVSRTMRRQRGARRTKILQVILFARTVQGTGMVTHRKGDVARLLVCLICGLALQCTAGQLSAQESVPSAAQPAATRSVGTVKTIAGKSIALTTDAGSDITILLQDGARLLRVE